MTPGRCSVQVRPTRVVIALALVAAAAGALRAVASEHDNDRPRADPGETAIALAPLPAVTRLGAFQVRVREPADPEEAALAGSGGPILEFEVTGPAGFRSKPTSIQVIWLYGKEDGARPPRLSVWSKTGASNYVRCSLVPSGTKYCTESCSDYEADDAGVHRVGEPRAGETCR